MQPISDTLKDLYEGKLLSPDELKLKAQDEATAEENAKVAWEIFKKQDQMTMVLKRLERAVNESLEAIENSTLNPEVKDSDIRILTVRYSTLKRTFNAINNNEEM